MILRNIIKLTKHIFSKYLEMKFSYLYSKEYSMNKFSKLKINTALNFTSNKKNL